MASTLWIGTRKGLFALRGDSGRRSWTLAGPQFLGHIIHHVIQDPREPKVVLMAAKTGHLGPTVFRSTDRGRTWKEASQPPAFRKALEAEPPKAVDMVFWLTPGHSSEHGTWYAGTSPAGLFRSEDAGATWQPVIGFNDHPMLPVWSTGQGTPVGPLLHSIRVDPRDARHLYLGISSGGVFESRDAGAGWAPMNAGCAADFLPDPDPQYGHDPHCVEMHPAQPGSAVPAESLWHLSARPAGPAMDPHRQCDAEEDRRHRVSDRAAPDRSGQGMGVPDGRHDRVAAHVRRRQACRVRHHQRREAPGDDSIADCRPGRAGSRCCGRRCARTTGTTGSACISARRRAKSGPAPTKVNPGAASHAICRRSSP